MNDPVELFKCLGDKTRFDILCQLYRSDSYVELLANNLGLTAGTISFHLKKMEKIGLVSCSRTQFYIIYSINRELIEKTIEAFLYVSPKEDQEEAYRKKVLSSFFVNGRLQQLPVQQKKREIVLCEILKDFDFDKDYPEREVNEIIMRYYDDYCTVRRWFIGNGFMTRNKEIYRLIKK